MIEGNNWCWPNEWYRKFPFLNHVQVPVLNIAKNDAVKWRDKNGNMVNFSTNEVWRDFTEDLPVVKWWKAIWFSQCNPRWAFTLWMAAKRKLLTQDRMMKWSTDNLLCPLCKNTHDSHNHLFFQCEYSKEVWKRMKKEIKIPYVLDIWDQIVLMMEEMNCSNSIWSVVNRFIIAATVYYIWKERNDRLFSQNPKSVEVVLQNIKDQVRFQLMSIKVRKTVSTSKVAEKWNIQFLA